LGNAGKARNFRAFGSTTTISRSVLLISQAVARTPASGGFFLENSALDEFGDIAQGGVRGALVDHGPVQAIEEPA